MDKGQDIILFYRFQKRGICDSIKSKQVTGYILYSSDVRRTVTQNNPARTFGEVSRIVGNEVYIIIVYLFVSKFYISFWIVVNVTIFVFDIVEETVTSRKERVGRKGAKNKRRDAGQDRER